MGTEKINFKRIEDFYAQFKAITSEYAEIIASQDLVIEELKKEVEALKVKITKALEDLN